jgi:hypothetical protein
MTAVMDKLQKLIAHEKSARAIGNIAEAEAFAAKVAELLFKHNLSMSDVEIKEQEINEPIDREYVRGEKGRSVWMEMLAQAVATSCFCRHMIIGGTSTQIFVGRTSDRQAAGALYRHLIGCAVSLVNAEKRKLRDHNPHTDPRRRQKYAHEFGRSYLLGFASAVSKRLEAERRQLETQTQGGTALVLRKNAALDRWWAEREDTFRDSRGLSVNLRNGDGFSRGVAAGNSINLKARAGLHA